MVQLLTASLDGNYSPEVSQGKMSLGGHGQANKPAFPRHLQVVLVVFCPRKESRYVSQLGCGAIHGLGSARGNRVKAVMGKRGPADGSAKLRLIVGWKQLLS